MLAAFAEPEIASAVSTGGADSLIVTLVLWALYAMSVATWAVVGWKIWRRRQVKSADTVFLDTFYESRGFEQIYAAARGSMDSGAARLFAAAYDELESMKKHGRLSARLTVTDLTRLIDRSLDRAGLDIRLQREVFLTFLATTASAAPFIGLFGTVVGIMNAFAEIGRMGSASLTVVAPGISEALIATAWGLAAAIPAAWFYNYQQRALDEEESALAGFRLELMNLLETYIFPEYLGIATVDNQAPAFEQEDD